MRIYHQDVQPERLDQFLEAVPQHAHVVSLPQHARDISGFHARRDQEHLARALRPEPRGYVVGGFLDLAYAPQIIVQAMAHLRFVQAEQNIDSRRLNVGIDDADTTPVARQQRGDIGGSIRFARPASIRVNRDNLGHRRFSYGLPKLWLRHCQATLESSSGELKKTTADMD